MSRNGGGIKYVEHKNIDYAKWDHCIEFAGNSRVYAMSWHLDRTAQVWDALVLGDYDFVMPLPFRKKWGITYLYQPLFSQQLGIFPAPPAEIAKLFYSRTVEFFRYSDMQVNSQNPVLSSDGILFVPRYNYILSLNKKYHEIAKDYSKNTKRNIAKSAKNNLNPVTGLRLEEYLEFKNHNLKTPLAAHDLKRLKSLIANGQYKGIGEIVGVYSNENKLLAAVYFCRWKDRIIYMNAATSEEGKDLRAMFFLLDRFLRKTAGNNLLLDLEGSMIPGVARLYAGFGGRPETYHQLKINRLPLPLKWLKQKTG